MRPQNYVTKQSHQGHGMKWRISFPLFSQHMEHQKIDSGDVSSFWIWVNANSSSHQPEALPVLRNFAQFLRLGGMVLEKPPAVLFITEERPLLVPLLSRESRRWVNNSGEEDDLMPSLWFFICKWDSAICSWMEETEGGGWGRKEGEIILNKVVLITLSFALACWILSSPLLQHPLDEDKLHHKYKYSGIVFSYLPQLFEPRKSNMLSAILN